jgi:hypothetical protein
MQQQLSQWLRIVAVAVFALTSIPAATQAVLPVLDDVSWQRVGNDVEFTLTFSNPNVITSDAVIIDVNLQSFGLGLPNELLLCNCEMDELTHGEVQTVVITSPESVMPPSAETRLPGGKPSGEGVLTPGLFCAVTNWAGNVDITWTGSSGTANANVHTGSVPVCPGGGASYIHVIIDCQDPAGAPWNFSGGCAGWTVSLVASNAGLPGLPAPNPIPAGVFDGWICVTAQAATPIGSVCGFNFNASCFGIPGTIQIGADACDWSLVSVEDIEWGEVKMKYRDQE